MHKKFIKQVLIKMHLYNFAITLRRWHESIPIHFTNFIFQRIFGINRDCPWSVNYTSRVMAPKNVKIHPSVKKSFAVSGGCYIQGYNGIIIDEGTIFAPGVKIISANHSLDDLRKSEESPPISIGKNCWIGANAIILPGVQLGNNVIVGAGSIVTKSFPAHCIIVGNPAEIKKKLK